VKEVFVSYSRANAEVVKQLIDDMKQMDVPAWYDQTLTGGQKWWDNILANIRKCDIFIFALSPDSLDSEACNSELHYVAGLGKTILPVQVTDGVNLSLLTPPLSEYQVLDYRQCDKKAAFNLVKAINAAPDNPPLPDPLPAQPPVPVSYLSTLKERIDAEEPLTSQAQITLLFKLEEALRDGRPKTEIKDLLVRFKKRDELLARVGFQIDAALKTIDEGVEDAAEEAARRRPAQMVRKESEQHTRPGSSELKYCPNCRGGVRAGTRFCANCGAQLGEMHPPSRQGGRNISNETETPSGAKVCRYICTREGAPKILADLKGWLGSEDFDLQHMKTEDNGLLLQIKKRGEWRKFVGMSTAFNIVLHHGDDVLTVEVGAGKWIDKAAAGAVSLFVLWPLAVTAGFGAWEQSKMPDRVFEFIGSRLAYA
jgi:TIR domain